MLIFLTFSSGCGGSSSGFCPGDEKLLKRFNRHSAEFEKLAANPEDPELHEELGIHRVILRSVKPRAYWFVVWFKDFPGPGGCFKGYAYSKKPLKPLVNSIDENSDPGSPEEKEIYRSINDKGWYLFYTSNH